MKFVLLTHPETLPNEHKALEAFFAAGLECLHLRKPEYSLEEMGDFLEGISKENRKKVVLHSHHNLGLKYEIKGLHYTSGVPFNTTKSYEGLQFSRSLHSVRALENCEPVYEYVFLSPVFNSISKKGHDAKFNFEELQDALTANRLNGGVAVYALGGLDEDTIAISSALGFSGAAVMGEIWTMFKENKCRVKGPVSDTLTNMLNACKMLSHVA
jgi:thiamine-phosphate pyrophosphorylase